MRRVRRAWLVGALVGGLALPASCSSDGGGGAGGQIGAQSSTTSVPATTTTVQLLLIPDPVDAPTEPLADRLEAELDLDSPSWVAAGESAVYIRGDAGDIYAVDPETNEVTTLAVVDQGDPCQGVGFGFNAVWSCAGSDVVAIDPETGELGDLIAVNKTATQGHLGTGFERVWVLVGDGSQLAGLDPDTGQLDDLVALGIRGTDLFVGDDGVWVVSILDDAVVRFDPDAAAVDLRVGGVSSPTSVAFSPDGSVWVGGGSATYAVDPSSGDVTDVLGGGTGADGALAVDASKVWVHSREPFLRALDGSTGEPEFEIENPDLTSGGDTVVAFGSVWITAYDDSVAYRLSTG